jgi:hypothetical protein
MVTGTTQNDLQQRTFIDYDPVTGRAIRQALRYQITLRIEASAIFPIAFSSQSRCVAPTKRYTGSSGYGCFGYVPLYWVEHARSMEHELFFRWYDHYYTRPNRGNTLTLAGIVLAAIFMTFGICIYVNEAYQRRKFYSRVYVD